MRKNNSTTDGFFATQKEKSRIKSLIVTEFFKAYFPIINAAFGKEIWYIDLFCGPGRYDDGSPSTPLILLDVIDQFKDEKIRQKINIVFNDRDPKLIEVLRKNVFAHPVIQKLNHKLQILNLKAAEIDLSTYTKGNNPIFSFVDPWGYKDVSAKQVWSLVKNSGSDCVLFFNSDRILQDINKKTNEKDFQQIFGNMFEQAKAIQTYSNLSQRQKAENFLSLFSENLYRTVQKESRGKWKLFILPFYVEADDKEKISHYIVFISKSHKAIQEMRKVMIKFGNSNSASLGYDSKKELQISLLSRNDDAFHSITETMRSFFSQYPKCYNQIFTIEELSQLLDRFSMYSSYKVLPYSHQELKIVIEELNKQGHIKIIEEPGKTTRKLITYKRKFRINPTLEGV